MRTTLTLDEDVAAKLMARAGGRRFKEVANKALRLGLQAMDELEESPPLVVLTTPVAGSARVRNIDNVWDVIAESEGDDFR